MNLEMKINSLHAIQRDMTTRYDRSLNEIDDLERMKEKYRLENIDLKNDKNDLLDIKARNETQIHQDKGKIWFLKTELNFMTQRSEDY